MSKIVYSYDSETKEYTGEYECQLDQLGNGYLIPANCLETKPIIVRGKVPVCENRMWVNKTDNRGKVFINKSGDIEQIKELGDFEHILTAKQYDEVMTGKSIKIENGKIVIFDKSDSAEYKIAQLHDKLVSMDYKGQKYLDGEYTEEEWAVIKSERQAIRQQIRELQNSIH